MLLHLNNTRFSSLKRLEMEKEILKQFAVLMSEIPGKLSTNNGGLSPCLHEEKWKQVILLS
ncbi:putative IS3 transposase [Yersinia similis]|uniref:Putative IS3 transposase n=1 Tax=Yersinia similis TaxID=367190 RepID=A0A0T9QU66_9GAMM|nr:putative IS3 transposase [Yersinia similis]CNF56635.1 putative IS3 transposase [Yersinia similis]CNF57910.1 putative IS3 transposase [Yersinia similis]CNI28786.1 putative IS3 transposase [Yersinia similis]